MIRKQLKYNENVKPNTKEMDILKRDFPQFFDKDENFLMDRFHDMLKKADIKIEKEGYELNFLGKSYAKYQTSIDATTVLVPDEEHNNKLENKNSENIYIVGDNIDALKHLIKSYSGRIKCIYIDPPYNTGSDGFAYPDDFKFSKEGLANVIGIEETEAERIISMTGKSTDSAWLMFIYPRLVLAHDLLTEDGVIFISIDDNEQANLKLICDEIFGVDNFISQIIVQSNKRGQTYKEIAKTHEYILVYGKTAQAKINQLTEEGKEFKVSDELGGFSERELRNRNPKFGKFNRPNLYFPIYVNPNKRDENGYYPISLEESDDYSIAIYPLNSKGEESCWRWGTKRCKANITHNSMRDAIVAKKKSTGKFGIYEKYRNAKVTAKTIWFEDDIYSTTDGVWTETDVISEKGSIELREEGLAQYFPFPKPVELIKKCIEIGLDYENENQYVLDFFSGSGTTAEAVEQLNSIDDGNRKFILVQLAQQIETATDGKYKTIDEIGCQRISVASKRIKKATNADIDYGFKIYRLETPSTSTLDKVLKFDPINTLLAEDMTQEFAFNGTSGHDTILTTWLNEDGYGMTCHPQKIKLFTYMAEFYEDSLYIIDQGLDTEDVMELIKKIENNEINIARVVLYPYSIVFNVIHELKKNLANLRNNKEVTVIERY